MRCLSKRSLVSHPGEYDFQNRGIAGNRIVDLYGRIKSDIINLKPDYISILIGVNDVWHELDYNNGVDADKFEKIYSMLIEEIKEALPEVKIMILEPFCLEGLEGSGTMNTEELPGKWNYFRTEVQKRAEKAENSYWLADGVHPTAMGHEVLKRE